MTPCPNRARHGRDLPLRARISESELETLYVRLYEPMTRELGWDFHLTREDAADLVHEAFELALTRLSSKGNPTVWLTRTASYLALNFVRTDARRASLLARWSPSGPELLAELGTPVEEMEEDS